MLFTSIAFALFLPLVLGLYWAIGAHRFRTQNALLIAASFLFYGWWDYRFVLLLLATTGFDFFVGMQLGRIVNERRRRAFFIASIVTNLTALGFFKYFNFFSDNFSRLLHSVGVSADMVTLQILLPIGISFYTFHSMSYVIDVYHRRKEPCSDPTAFFAFISFFPQLVAGPIVRATWFLPQFQTKRKFAGSKASDGLRQMLWGFFKKMVIADGCAHFVNPIFEHWSTQSSGTLVAGAVLFAFQIYGDFSGYSDIAIGTARLFGFHLLPNFRFPYFSRDVAEFWRRWHISLTSWFRDYVYIPLGGNRSRLAITIRNTIIVFLLSGFWHGASWTFIAWGGLHALYFLPLIVFRNNRIHLDVPAVGKWLPSIKEFAAMLLTFILVCIAWIFFRAPDLETATHYIGNLLTMPWGSIDAERRIGLFIGLMMTTEWINRTREYGLQIGHLQSRAVRWSIYTTIALLIFYFGAPAQNFIYFQF